MEKKDKEKQENEKNVDDTDDKTVLVEKALKSFCCYLYVGKGHPYYKARPWNDNETYPISKRLLWLDILAANKKTELVPIDKIKLAMDSKLICRPETLMFALAMCARQKKSEKLRAAAYYFLSEHCKEWKYFILFIKYTSILCKMEESNEEGGNGKHIGCGHGWKNAVNKWYLTQSPTSLIQLVTHHKGDHGWKHKDILKLSHPNTTGLEVEKRAIICYIIRGLKEAKKEYGNDPEAKKMLDHLENVEFFKNCKHPKTVVKLIKTGNFTIDQVHPKALKSKEVWLALLEKMDVRTILKNLPKLTNLGLLTKGSHATKLVVQSLTDENNLRWNKVLPGDVLPILSLYETQICLGYTLKCNIDLEARIRESFGSEIWDSIPENSELAEKPETKPKSMPKTGRSKKRNVVAAVENANDSQTNAKLKPDGQKIKPTEPRPVKQPDVEICHALRTSLNIAMTVDITESSKRSYLVSLRFPGRRYDFPSRNKYTHAGLAIAVPLLHRDDLPEDAVTIVGYHEAEQIKGLPCEITKEMNFGDAIFDFNKKKRENENYPMGPSPLLWAWYKKEKKYDVFINVMNEPPKEITLDYMHRCKEISDPLKIRIINVILNSAPFEMKGEFWNDTLTINGFDPHVPWIIEAYARGLF